MSKNKRRSVSTSPDRGYETESGRGIIRDNALKAVVTSELFRTRVVKAKKGKGSFQRNNKHKGREPYAKTKMKFCIGLSCLSLPIRSDMQKLAL